MGEDFLKCPNCNAAVSEDKTHCESCGYHLVEGDQDEVGAFIRDAMTSPWTSIGRPHSIKAALISVSVMAAVFAAFGIMHLGGGYSDSGFAALEIVFAAIPSFILMAILFLFGYLSTVMFQGLVTKQAEEWKQVFTDFSKAMLPLYLVYLIVAFTVEYLPYSLQVALWCAIYLLTISVPVFVTLGYAVKDNAKFNMLLSVLIYYVSINVPVAYFTFSYFYNH